MENEYERGRGKHWETYASREPVTVGHFYAELDRLYDKLERIEDQLHRVESTVNAPRDFMVDLITSTWLRVMIIVGTILVGMALTQADVDYRDWLPF